MLLISRSSSSTRGGGNGLDGLFAPVFAELVKDHLQFGLVYRLYRGFRKRYVCIGVVFPADQPVGNVDVVFEVFGRCVLL